MEADGKKADEGTTQDYPMARYDKSYDLVCTCIFTRIACVCWCHMQTTKRLPYLYTVLVLKLEE